jgi:hypothetical protein
MLMMAPVVLTTFKANHPGKYVPDDLQVKLQILTVANLFFRRHIRSWWLPSGATLHGQRKRNTERAKNWMQCQTDSGIIALGGTGSLVVSKSSLAANRQDMMSHLSIPYCQSLPDLKFAISLLDILPEYMVLCKMVPLSVRDNWMDEAVIFMLQSAIEQVLIYGKPIEDSADGAFAWDWAGINEQLPEIIGCDDVEINAWEDKRTSLKASLFPNEGLTWETHFRRLLTEFPLLHLEEMILELLSSLLNMLDTPILMQLEAGKLDGLTTSETQAFKDRIGIN